MSLVRDGSRVTSVDVARRAGVSQSTVSLVLSSKAAGRVSEATAAAVLEGSGSPAGGAAGFSRAGR
jgi:DNA transposition AAA+ family ATPase